MTTTQATQSTTVSELTNEQLVARIQQRLALQRKLRAALDRKAGR